MLRLNQLALVSQGGWINRGGLFNLNGTGGDKLVKEQEGGGGGGCPGSLPDEVLNWRRTKTRDLCAEVSLLLCVYRLARDGE